MREMTPAEKAGIVKGKKYVVTSGYRGLQARTGLIVELWNDDKSECPWCVVVKEKGFFPVGERVAIFLERLKPYEGDDMEMPKLEAGMVVELESEGDVYGPYLVITENWFISFNGCAWQDLAIGMEVTKIWRKQVRRALKYVETHLDDPIWERQSSEERQKREQREELQKKLEEAQALVAEVQNEIAKL